MPAALLDDVTVTYGRHGVRGVDRLSLTVAAGRVTGLLGPNGAGKSTTVAVLAGLTRVSRGRAETLGGRPGRPEARRDLHV